MILKKLTSLFTLSILIITLFGCQTIQKEDSPEKRKKEIESIDFVDEVVYDSPLVKLLDENIKKITLILLFITSIFVFIAVILINSSIRLSIYSKRFLIKTMQLVGATKSFVRKPFIWNHVRLGIISSIISLIALSLSLIHI